MISQFFEIHIAPGQERRYLESAASLKPMLDEMGGCIFLDRYKSVKRPGVLLSFQIWRDEGTMTAWRVHPVHHGIQVLGREKVFSDYRIRIAQVIHEAKSDQRSWRPERLTPYNDPARRPPTYVLASESRNPALPVSTEWNCDAFTSMYREGHCVHVIDVPDPRSGIEFGSSLLSDSSIECFRIFEVMRDYGKYNRREAPQYYPPVERDPSDDAAASRLLWEPIRR